LALASSSEHSGGWRGLRRVLLIYLCVAAVVAAALGGIGYYGGGWEGALNGLALGGLLSLIALPALGLLISVRFWGGYANRWGESQFQKMEGEPEDRAKKPKN
jgi:hypothetical protein